MYWFDRETPGVARYLARLEYNRDMNTNIIVVCNIDDMETRNYDELRWVPLFREANNRGGNFKKKQKDRNTQKKRKSNRKSKKRKNKNKSKKRR